jgi:excisionase family DNA binding protein
VEEQKTVTTNTEDRSRRKDKAKTPPTPEILKTRVALRVSEFAALTGTPVPTVYAYIAAGKIPGVTRIGSSLRIPVSAVTALMGATA